MSELTDGFKKIISGQVPDEPLLVPLLIWLSGYEKNIEACQRINRKFFSVNRKLLILELTLYNTLKHFLAYPKGVKKDEKLEFFHIDLCRYFGWTYNEFQSNLNFLNMEEVKVEVANAFGYDDVQRKIIGLEAKYGTKRTGSRQVRQIT